MKADLVKISIQQDVSFAASWNNIIAQKALICQDIPWQLFVLCDKIHEPCYFILQYKHAKWTETQYNEHTLTAETTSVIMQGPSNNRYTSVLM